MRKLCGVLVPVLALVLALGLASSSLATGPTLVPNISYGSCDTSCGRPAVRMLSSASGRAALMFIEDGCTGHDFPGAFGSVRISRSGKFHATRVVPHAGPDPTHPGNLLDVTQTIRGRVLSPRKIVGTAMQSDAVCSIDFGWVARQI
jgi:hypothetical protein